MVREISAGGVVVRPRAGAWWVAVIHPRQDDAAPTKRKNRSLLALPKGQVDAGEKPDQTALREVREETGLTATLVTKLTDIKYVYTRSWGDGARVFKIVSFYLLRYQAGRIDDIAPEMRLEIERALWVPLAEADQRLGYRTERQVIQLARQYLESHPEV